MIYYNVYVDGLSHPIKERVGCHDHEIVELKNLNIVLVYEALDVFRRLAF